MSFDSYMIIAAVVALTFLCFVPYGIEPIVTDSMKPRDLSIGFNVVKNESFADVTVTTGNMDFINEMASAAGMSTGSFVATVVGASSAAVGMAMASETGVRLGDTAADSLNNLIEAADYPAYETLDSTQQTAWQTKENYDAAKFNALMDAFGMSDDRDRFYSSGGGNFEFSEDAKDKLEQIGNIGERWVLGLGNAFSSISALLDRDMVIEFIGSPESDVIHFDASTIEGWSSSYPQSFDLGFGTEYSYGRTDPGASRVWVCSNPSCYYLVMKVNNNMICCLFSRDSFRYISQTNSVKPSNINAVPYTITSYANVFYYANVRQTASFIENGNMPYNILSSELPESALRLLCYNVLFGNGITAGVFETMEGYPEDTVPDDTRVYYPQEGITPETIWNNFITPGQVVRPDNNYNPDNQSGGNSWKNDTEANVIPLQNIRFDKLFPFCLMYDLKMFMEKLVDLGVAPASNVQTRDMRAQDLITSDGYMHIHIDLSSFGEFMSNGNEETEIDLDLVTVHDLLIIVRPALQVLLIFGLLWTVILFWKGVIAG